MKFKIIDIVLKIWWKERKYYIKEPSIYNMITVHEYLKVWDAKKVFEIFNIPKKLLNHSWVIIDGIFEEVFWKKDDSAIGLKSFLTWDLQIFSRQDNIDLVTFCKNNYFSSLDERISWINYSLAIEQWKKAEAQKYVPSYSEEEKQELRKSADEFMNNFKKKSKA